MHKYAVPLTNLLQILAVSVQTRVELSCFIVHLEFFSHRQGSLQEIRLSWMRSGHQSESFNDHSRSRGRFSFAKVAVDYFKSASSALHGVSVFGISVSMGISMSSETSSNSLSSSVEMRSFTSQGGKILRFFRAQIWLDFGG